MQSAITPQLSLARYQEQTAYSDQFAGKPDAIHHMRYGFFGEVGGLLVAVKKAHRELSLSQSENDMAKEEIGDALWYLTALVRQTGLALNDVGASALQVLLQILQLPEVEPPVGEVLFNEIDGLLAFGIKRIPTPPGKQLYALAAHAGALLASFDIEVAESTSARLLQQFAELLAALAMVATNFHLRLAVIAEANIEKITSRWRKDNAPYHTLFDDSYLEHEKFPRQFDIEFIEREVRGKKFVVQQLRTVNIGDPLTDNRVVADDYRFHDVFHLAYVAHLGWSPVIRGLLKIKRKSNQSTDENEDGARAMIIEEGIATWIFNYARDRGHWFSDVPEGKLEYGLLKQVHTMVSGYEVDQCPLWQWEKAILDGFVVFRELRDKRGGIVKVDMNAHSLTYEASKGDAL